MLHCLWSRLSGRGEAWVDRRPGHAPRGRPRAAPPITRLALRLKLTSIIRAAYGRGRRPRRRADWRPGAPGPAPQAARWPRGVGRCCLEGCGPAQPRRHNTAPVPRRHARHRRRFFPVMFYFNIPLIAATTDGAGRGGEGRPAPDRAAPASADTATACLDPPAPPRPACGASTSRTHGAWRRHEAPLTGTWRCGRGGQAVMGSD